MGGQKYFVEMKLLVGPFKRSSYLAEVDQSLYGILFLFASISESTFILHCYSFTFFEFVDANVFSTGSMSFRHFII